MLIPGARRAASIGRTAPPRAPTGIQLSLAGEFLMSRRIVLSVAAGVVVLGGAGAFALAYAGDQSPALAHSTARYTAPAADRDGSFGFTTDVRAEEHTCGLPTRQ